MHENEINARTAGRTYSTRQAVTVSCIVVALLAFGWAFQSFAQSFGLDVTLEVVTDVAGLDVVVMPLEEVPPGQGAAARAESEPSTPSSSAVPAAAATVPDPDGSGVERQRPAEQPAAR